MAPTVIDNSAWNEADAPRVVLFSIVHDGVTTDYSMPERPHAGVALGFLKRSRVEGEIPAAAWLLEQVLGVEAYDALAVEPGVTLDQINEISRLALSVATGRAAKVKPAEPEPVTPAPTTNETEAEPAPLA